MKALRNEVAAITLAAWAMAMGACAHKRVPAMAAGGVAANDNSYMDLAPGWRLRAVMPLTKSGRFDATGLAPQGESGTTFVSSGDLVGYRTIHYSVRGARHGEVRIQFVSAEDTRDGKTVAGPEPPAPPIRFPRRSGHVRLIYLVRRSESDHDMAIVASRRMDALNAFTGRLKEHPEICGAEEDVFCSWVPPGVALRPEKD